VLGTIDERAKSADPTAPIGDIMTPGPTTLRPNTSLDQARERLAKRNLKAFLVTSSDGRLMGMFRAD